MAQDSKIEWTHHTANLWHGCTKVHEGCDHCYAETLSKRWKRDIWGNDKPRLLVKSVWDDLAKYQKMAAAAGEMHRVFVGSMMDIFEKPMPMVDSKGNPVSHPIMGKEDVNNELGYSTGDLRSFLFSEISNGIYNNLQFLFLTKRPSNINKYIPESWKDNPPENVMFGTSPVNQETFNKLVPQLCQVKGQKFLSIEPQLAPINITTSSKVDGDGVTATTYPISWIIQGGESGHHRRPFDLQWAYQMQFQCEKFEIPYFFKQIDKVLPIPDDLLIRQFPTINFKPTAMTTNNLIKWNLKHLEKLEKQGKIKGFKVNKHPVREKNGNIIHTNRGGNAALEWLRLNLGFWSNEHALTMHEEYRFHKERRYRFDFCWPAIMVALEFEGGIFMQRGAHNTPGAIERDIHKYELAAKEGWTVLRVTAMSYKTAPQKLNEQL